MRNILRSIENQEPEISTACVTKGGFYENLQFEFWYLDACYFGRANNVITRLLQLSINPILVGGNSLLQQETKVSLTSLRRKTGLDFDNRGLKSDKV